MKKLAILYSEYSPVIDAIICQLDDVVEIGCFTNLPDNYQIYDLIVAVNYLNKEYVNLLKCHYSLLPSFNSDEPVKDAFFAGVKVTGITIYFTNPEKIIMQYPIFIDSDTHFDDLENQLSYIEQSLFPVVINKILNNEVVDIKMFLNHAGSCGGCSGCNR